MSVTGISGSSSAQSVDPKNLFMEWADKKLRSRGDTVTISDEARQKAEEAAKAKLAEETPLPGEESVKTEGSGNAQASGGGGGTSSPESTEDRITDLESKLKALMDQVSGIMQGALPMESKMQQTQPLLAQVGQLQAQLTQLKAQMMQESSGKA